MTDGREPTFDAGRFESLRRQSGLALGAPLSVFRSTGSTNDDALEAAAAGAPHGATFVADHQQRGRGRRGTRWIAPPETGLLASVILRPTIDAEALSALPLCVGLSVREAVARALGPGSPRPVLVKWPNDVWVSERKIAGILVESRWKGPSALFVVVGIGINTTLTELSPELRERATSLQLEGGRTGREPLLHDTLVELVPRLLALVQGGPAALHAELQRFDALRGRKVRVDRGVGVAVGIDPRGHLLVELEKSSTIAVSSGSVEATR
jgi:BirA family transcriptional regulator, biotin operon repressor / biotin---[acetyl-CoA-carboxylase] ligase